MRPEVHWIELPAGGRLAIMPRPRAGDWLEDEIAGWKAEGIDVVVSLLEPHEVRELGLDREAALCREQSIDFIAFPLPDRDVPPSRRDATALARLIVGRIGAARAVAIHCRAGIGRAALLAACVLICLGSDADAAFGRIARARGVAVPDTEEQRAWAEGFLASTRPAGPAGVPGD